MKNLHILFILIICILYPAINQAQSWKWATGETPGSSEIEMKSMVADQFGNFFEAGYIGAGSALDSTVFGACVLHHSASGSLLVTKTDSNGNYLWVLGTVSTEAFPNGIATDAAGNVYVYGTFWYGTFSLDTITITSPTAMNYFIAKISPSGRALWVKKFASYSKSPSTGGIGVDDAGNIFVTGDFCNPSLTIGSSTLTNTNPTGDSSDVYIAKFTSAGIPVWAKSFGGFKNDVANALSVTNKGDIFIAGQYNSDTMNISGNILRDSLNFLAAYDSSGNCIWAKSMGRYTQVYGMATDRLENIYLTGGLDTSIIWGTDTLVDRGGSWFFPGGDAFVAKLDSRGDVQWARSDGGDSTDLGYSIVLDSCGNVWACGGQNMSGFANPGYVMHFGTHTTTTTPGGWGLCWEPMFVVEYDNDGNFLTAVPTQCGGDDWNSIAVDRKGNFYISGDYHGYPVFGADTLAYSGGSELAFVAKYNYAHGSCSAIVPSLGVQPVLINGKKQVYLYPNPSTNEITIRNAEAGSKLSIFNLMGKQVYSSTITDEKQVVDTKEFIPSTYLVEITANDGKHIVLSMIKD